MLKMYSLMSVHSDAKDGIWDDEGMFDCVEVVASVA